MKAPPKWAQDLMLDALLWWESRGHIPPNPELNWRRGSRSSSSGTAYETHKIVVTAGSNRIDQKLVLLHELAHTMNPDEHHSIAFWDTAWALYRRAKLPIRYCIKREKSYRVGAMVSYHRNRHITKEHSNG